MPLAVLWTEVFNYFSKIHDSMVINVYVVNWKTDVILIGNKGKLVIFLI